MATQKQLEELFKASSSSGIRKLLSKNGWDTLSPQDQITWSSLKATVVFYPSESDSFSFEVVFYPDGTFESFQSGRKQNEKVLLRGEEFIKALDLTRRVPKDYYFYHLTLSLTNEDDSFTQVDKNTLSVMFRSNPDESVVIYAHFYGDKTYKINSYCQEPLGTQARMAAVKRCLDLIQKFEMRPRETEP
jgi:hypothetical protein